MTGLDVGTSVVAAREDRRGPSELLRHHFSVMKEQTPPLTFISIHFIREGSEKAKCKFNNEDRWDLLRSHFIFYLPVLFLNLPKLETPRSSVY